METVLFTLGTSAAGSAAITFTLGNAFSLAGGLFSMLSSSRAGESKAQQHEADAILAQREAQREREIGERDADDLSRQRSFAAGTNRALRGGFGTVDSTGTNLLKQEQFIEQTALDVEMVRVGGATKANTLESEAALSRAKGKAARAQGRSDAGASLLGGITKAFA